MATYLTRTSTGPRGGLIRAISLIVSVIVGFLVIGILLVDFGANRDNGFVSFVLDVGRFFAGPFDNIFSPGGHKLNVLVNWGLAAIIYAGIGALLMNALGRRPVVD